MRVAVFSDIHSNYEALEAIINDIKNNNYDRVICLGDILAKGPSPRECLDLIIKNNIEMVIGNHELYYLYGTSIDKNISDSEVVHQKWVWGNLEEKHKSFLMNCDYEININNVSFKHFLYNPVNGKYPFYSLDIFDNGELFRLINLEKCDYIFSGHEHISQEYNTFEKKMVVVGSSGCVSDDETFYTVVDIGEEVKYNIKKLKYDREKFINKINLSDYPERYNNMKIFFNIY